MASNVPRKRLPVLPAKPAPESVSKINPGFAKPA